MKLNIDFDELCGAFEESDVSHHYFIDTKENKLIYINDEVDDNPQEELEKMGDDRYIHLPERMPNEGFEIMENFAYTIKDFKVAEKFHEVLENKKPFRNFKDLLLEYPELREDWFKYKDKQIKNEVIDWLLEKDIELEGQKLISSIEINELNDLQNLPEDIKGFGPVGCLKCNNKEGLKARFFLINVAPENKLIENWTKKIMKEKYGISHYGNFTGGEKELLTASKCPKCGSEELFWDY